MKEDYTIYKFLGRSFMEIGKLDSAYWSFDQGLRYSPDDESLLEYAAWNAGKIKVEAKDEFKKRLGGRSCDLADAFCLTFAQQAFTASVRGTQHNWNKPISYKDNSWIT